MFNGIIFNHGIVYNFKKDKKGTNLFLKSNIKLNKKHIGISLSCDGVCLTVVSIKKNILQFYLSSETIKRSKFQKIKIGDKINLELPLKKNQRISGHICQGHVDTTAKVNKILKKDKSLVFDFFIDKKFKKFLIEKASILINGVSLTISNLTENSFKIWVIPHTLKYTNLSNLKKGDIVNVEIDILSKYIKRFINEKK